MQTELKIPGKKQKQALKKSPLLIWIRGAKEWVGGVCRHADPPKIFLKKGEKKPELGLSCFFGVGERTGKQGHSCEMHTLLADALPVL